MLIEPGRQRAHQKGSHLTRSPYMRHFLEGLVIGGGKREKGGSFEQKVDLQEALENRALLEVPFCVEKTGRTRPFYIEFPGICSESVRNTPSTAENSMTGCKRPSPERLLKKEASPAVLGKRINALEASNALNSRAWGIPAVLSREIPGKALRAFPGSFRNFFRKVPAVLGVWPNLEILGVKRLFCNDPCWSSEIKSDDALARCIA